MIPGADPNYPPYGRGTGASPAAEGEAALEVAPKEQIEVLTDPAITRRERRYNQQALGLTIPSIAGYDQTPSAEIQPPTSNAAVDPRGNPEGNYGVTPPDDANRAGATIRQ